MTLAESNTAEVAQWIMCGLGVLGFVAALGSLYWQHWQYRDSKRMKLEARVSQVARPGLTQNMLDIAVWNKGHVPVYIDSVGLVCTAPTGMEGKSVADSLEVPFDREGGPGIPLEPGERMKCRMKGYQSAAMKVMAEAPTDTVYLSIKGGGKELLRLSGSEVHGPVKGVWASREHRKKLLRKIEEGKIGT